MKVIATDMNAGDAARQALESCISKGEVVLFPSDGIYGLACDPLNEKAVDRIHAIKGRDDGKSSAVMYFSPLAMRELVRDLGQKVSEAFGRLLPGPVTLIVPNPRHRYPLACREDPARLGVRVIDGPLAGVRCPIFQTSANLSGEPAPASFAGVVPEVREEVDLAIDGGELTGLPSTVVDLTELDENGVWTVLREGGMSRGDLIAALGH
ncbi:MAG TPA: L-threonylcarbamoyladenylate synthase [Solirubrobacterales bacterium]|nr:L-threonylcarbamoyladenylate synthase [Solirubrobacterales bacterium]